MRKREEAEERRDGYSEDQNKDRGGPHHRIEVLNKAKEIIMQKFNMSEAEAHRYIQKSAMDSRKGMVEVAEMIIVLYGNES